MRVMVCSCVAEEVSVDAFSEASSLGQIPIDTPDGLVVQRLVSSNGTNSNPRVVGGVVSFRVDAQPFGEGCSCRDDSDSSRSSLAVDYEYCSLLVELDVLNPQ